MLHEVSSDVAAYWDENRDKSKDPTFWMAHPACRAAINRRVTGNPHEWPLGWFKRVYVPKPFEHGVSWGCGLGPLERALIRDQIVNEIDAFDISPASLKDARNEAAREGLIGINYDIGDFNDPHLDGGRYDIAFFHQSLHHVSALERLFRRLVLALRPGALVYVDEYVGPSRHEWRDEDLRLAQAILDMLPAEAKLGRRVELPIEPNDTSEAIRSSEIEAFLRSFLDILAWRPYGGQVVDLVLPLVRHDWAHSEAGAQHLQAMMNVEEYELMTRPASNHHVVAVGRIKPLRRLGRTLSMQVLQALKRRASRLWAE